MRIDKQTIRDLEIFKTDDGETSIFDLINKTKTTGGEYRLREICLNPPENIELLKEQQDSVRYLVEKFQYIKLPFNNQQIKSIEDYLSSNIDIVQADSLLDCFKFCIIDFTAYKYLKNSILEVHAFIAGFQAILNHHNLELPLKLKKIQHEIESLSNNNAFKKTAKFQNKKPLAFYHALQSDRIVRTEFKSTLTSILNGYYDLDALFSMAKATKELNFNFPEFIKSEESIFSSEGLYHPLLPNAVPSDITLTKDSNFVFLSGPNMSGKTTFLKTIGIAVYLAHLGMGIPSKHTRLTYVDCLFTSLNINDNILKGYSFFYSEVLRVKKLAEILKSGEKVFSLFDELFRGTNVMDAYDATILVISGLFTWQNSLFIVSSHLWEVWEKIKHYPTIKSLCFESKINNGIPEFTYCLTNGVSDMRLGLTIIKNEKIMELLKH